MSIKIELLIAVETLKLWMILVISVTKILNRKKIFRQKRHYVIIYEALISSCEFNANMAHAVLQL